jgi:hypothetical protein
MNTRAEANNCCRNLVCAVCRAHTRTGSSIRSRRAHNNWRTESFSSELVVRFKRVGEEDDEEEEAEDGVGVAEDGDASVEEEAKEESIVGGHVESEFITHAKGQLKNKTLKLSYMRPRNQSPQQHGPQSQDQRGAQDAEGDFETSLCRSRRRGNHNGRDFNLEGVNGSLYFVVFHARNAASRVR